MSLQDAVKNTGALTISTFLNKAMQMVVMILLGRYLGAEGYGLYTTAYAFVNVFSHFHELGVSQLMVQDGSRDRTQLPVYFGNALLIKVVAVSVVFIVMLAVMLMCAIWIGFSAVQCTMIVILGIAMGFYNVNQTIFSYYQTIEKMSVTAGFQFIQAFLIAVLTLGVIFVTHQGVVAVTMTHFISYVSVAVLLVLVLRREPRPVVDRSRVPKMIRDGLPFGLQRAVNAVIPNAVVFVMSLLLVSDQEIGIFRAAQILVVTLVFLPNTFAYAIYPILFRLGSDNEARHQATMEKVFKIMAAVGIPISLFFSMFPREIVVLIWGDEFAAAAPVFAVLSWYFALECLSYPLGDVMMTMNRQWQRAVLQGGSLVLLVALTLWAQPRYGIMGSTWVILAVEAFLFLGYYVFIRAKMYPIRIWRQLPLVLAASLITMGAAYLIRGWHVVLVACVTGLFYLAVLFVLDKELRGLLKRALRG